MDAVKNELEAKLSQLQTISDRLRAIKFMRPTPALVAERIKLMEQSINLKKTK